MDPRLITILTKKCAASAAQSAKSICHLARQREIEINTLVDHFQKLLPKHKLDEIISDWGDAERVITRACFILESQQVLENYRAGCPAGMEA